MWRNQMTPGLRFLNLSDVDRIPHYYQFTTPFFGPSLFDQKNRESIFYQALTRPSRMTRICGLLARSPGN